jgi:hypothetical protein
MTREEMIALMEQGAAETGGVAVRPDNYEASPQEGEGRADGAGPVRGFLGDVVEQLGPYGKLDDMISARQGREAGAQRTIENTMTGIDKGLSFGLAGTLNAATDTLADKVRGVDGPSFSERRAQSNQLVNENSNLGGEFFGALAGGPRAVLNAAEEGIKKLPVLGQLLQSRGAGGMLTRTGAAATVGSTEAALYTLAEGGTLDEAGTSALYGAAFGGILQPTAEGIGAFAKLIKPAFGLGADVKTGEDLVELFGAAYGEDFVTKLFGQNAFDADAIAARMQELGREDATLLEVFPDALAKTVRTMSGASHMKVARATRELMDYQQNLQNLALPEFQQSIGAALGSPDVRSLTQIENQGRQLRSELEPQYDAALANTRELPSGRVTGVPTSRIEGVMSRAFPNREYGAEEAVYNRLRSMIPSRTVDARGRRIDFTPQQLLTLRKQLDGVIYNGRFGDVGTMDGGSSIDQEIVRNNLRPVRDAVRDMLYEIAPDVKVLDAQYGTEIGLRHAFEAGVGAAKSSSGSDLYDTFIMTSDRSPPEIAAFIEGVKSRILDDLEVKASPLQVRSYMQRAEMQGRLDLIRHVVGPDAVQELVAATERLSVMRQIGRGVDTEMPSVFSEQSTGLGNLGDWMLMGGAASNVLSTAIGAGAGRRQIAQLGQGGTGPAAQAGVLSNLMQMPATQAAGAVNDRLQADVPALLRGLAGFVPPVASELSDDQ